MTTKSTVLVPVPDGPVTVIRPVVAPAGTTAVICVGESTVNVVATPPNETPVAPLKFVPVSTTVVPTRPNVGENDEIVGGVTTVKLVLLVAVPAELETDIRPVVAPAGTVAVIRVEEFTVKVVPTPLNATDVMAVKLDPLIVTVVPAGPVAGVNDEIVGVRVTTKSAGLVPVPFEVVTVTRPVVAPVGTVAVICVGEFTVNGAATPSNRTWIVPLKPVPVMTTLAPTGPLDGVSAVMVGAPGVIVKFVALVAVPLAVTTEIGPVVAPAGTTAVMRVLLLTVNDVAFTPLNRTAATSVKLVPLI